MLNRWQGNTGKVERINEAFLHPSPPSNPPPLPAPPPVQRQKGGMLDGIGRLLPGISEPLDSEDLLLLLILYLLYRESGDTELLIIMGAMFLL